VKEAYGHNFCTSEDFTPTCQTNPHLIALVLETYYYLERRQHAWHGHHNHLTNKKYVSLANQGLK
jgi:hypothetical protein